MKVKEDRTGAENSAEPHYERIIIMIYQWYPGHMTKAKRQMQEDIKLIDLVIELVDARIPYSSKNPDIDALAKGKSRIILLNKSDMSDSGLNERWKQYYEKQGFYTALINSKNNHGMKPIHDLIQEACSAKLERDRKRGILGRPVRAMIVGIPNVGKSTFINSFAGKACAKTGNKPGVTKGKQWIKLNKKVELLDTPGILWPKFENQKIGLRIAMIGSINEDILQPVELALKLMEYITEHYSGYISNKYGIEESKNYHDMLRQLAIRRGCILKGGEPDVDRAAFILTDDFRSNRIGNITLEEPEDVDEKG